MASLRSTVTAEEWTARVQLAAAYRIFDHLGWTELIYNHISLRLPGEHRHFLVNPFGLHYSEVTASNLVKIDLRGNVVGESPWPINPAGFTPHATIHGNIDGAHCVMHTHTTAGLAVACLEDGLSMSNFYSAQLHGKVAYHDFEGITVHADEGPRLLASIGDRQAVILRNHGLLAWGSDLPRAFAILWLLQRACEIQLATLSMGKPRMWARKFSAGARPIRCSSTRSSAPDRTCSTRSRAGSTASIRRIANSSERCRTLRAGNVGRTRFSRRRRASAEPACNHSGLGRQRA